MSTNDENKSARIWRFAEELLAEEEDERLASLSPEERRVELEKRGVKPATEWNVQEMIAGAAASASKLTVAGPLLSPESSPSLQEDDDLGALGHGYLWGLRRLVAGPPRPSTMLDSDLSRSICPEQEDA